MTTDAIQISYLTLETLMLVVPNEAASPRQTRGKLPAIVMNFHPEWADLISEHLLHPRVNPKHCAAGMILDGEQVTITAHAVLPLRPDECMIVDDHRVFGPNVVVIGGDTKLPVPDLTRFMTAYERLRSFELQLGRNIKSMTTLDIDGLWHTPLQEFAPNPIERLKEVIDEVKRELVHAVN